MAKIADQPPACILVINKHDGLSHFAFEETPSTGPGVRPVLGYATLVPRINAIDPSRIKTDLAMKDFFAGDDIIVSPSPDTFRGMVAGDPTLIDHAQSVPALRLVATMCPDLADKVEQRIQFLRDGGK